MLKRFLKDDSGATAIEYGILAAMMAVAVVAAVGALDLTAFFTDVNEAISGRIPGE